MKILILILIFCLGCYRPAVQTKNYAVVSLFDEIVFETDNRLEAYEYSHNLTLMGKIHSNKLVYFVIEKSVNSQ